MRKVKVASKAEAGAGAEEEEEGEEDDDAMSWETARSDYEELSEDEEGGDGDAEVDVLRVSHLGELVLPDGRTLGSREFRNIYKQRVRLEGQDERVVVAAEAKRPVGMEDGGEIVEVQDGPGGALATTNGSRKGRGEAKVLMKIIRAARRHDDKVRMRTELKANKFHKRPQIGV
jgi:hypothetical protein